MSEKPNHVLIITVDQEALRVAQDEDSTVDPNDQDLWEISIRCEHSPDDYTRECMTWWQCDCVFTEKKWHDLADEGEGPCPESPTGLHRSMFGTLRAGRPSRDCWAQVCDRSVDSAWSLVDRYKLGPGEYRVIIDDSDEDSIDFELADSPQAVTS